MTMITSQGTAQIVVYVLVLLILTPLLGSYMARVYEGEQRAARPVVRLRRARLLPAAAHSPDEEQDWKGYGPSVLVFSLLFLIPLYVLLRVQGHLPLNPNHLSDVNAGVSRQHRRQLRHEHELAVLRRRVHHELPEPDGRARGAELHLRRRRHGGPGRDDPRLRPPARRRSSGTSGSTSTARPSTSCCRSSIVARGDPGLAGRAPHLQRPRGRAHASRATRRASPAARSRRRSRSSSSAPTAAAYYNSNSAVPFENPTGFTNFLEMLAILLIRSAAGVHVRQDGAATRQGWAIFAAMFVDDRVGVVVAAAGRAARVAGAAQSGVEHDRRARRPAATWRARRSASGSPTRPSGPTARPTPRTAR